MEISSNCTISNLLSHNPHNDVWKELCTTLDIRCANFNHLSNVDNCTSHPVVYRFTCAYKHISSQQKTITSISFPECSLLRNHQLTCLFLGHNIQLSLVKNLHHNHHRHKPCPQEQLHPRHCKIIKQHLSIIIKFTIHLSHTI